MASNTVRCVCGNVDVSGTYEVRGRFLIITSRLGVAKVVVGLQDPRKLAARLLKNTCKKASARTYVDQTSNRLTAAERATERVDKQRDKIVAMAPDAPMRPSEERMLDQMIETSRMVERAAAHLKVPEASEDASNAASSPPR